MEDINLQKGEEIIFETRPDKKLKTYWLYNVYLLLGFIGIFFLFPIVMMAIDEGLIVLFIGVLASLIIFGIILIISGLLISNSYSYRYYWVTNKRILYKRGTLGYKVSSIPLNRISDVILSKTFLERIAGIESIRIQTLAGQISGGRTGSEGDLAAVPNALELQRLILDAIEKYGKDR